jgi:hypothetical protein
VVTRLYEGIDALQLAARAMAENLLPVIERLDGGGPLAQVGTAFVFRHDNHAVIVTADHVVCGPTQKFVQLGPGETIRWPRPYVVVKPVHPNTPSPDLAFVTGELLGERPKGIRLKDIGTNSEHESGASLLAVGYPGSRAKLRQGDHKLRNELHYVLGSAVPLDAYASLGLDPRSHIAMYYDRAQMNDPAGKPTEAAKPGGMSGGVLFAPLVRGSSPTGEHVVAAIGVLVRFKQRDGVLVATRIEPLLDALGMLHAGSDRTYTQETSNGDCGP